jgi:hypothetical protein
MEWVITVVDLIKQKITFVSNAPTTFPYTQLHITLFTGSYARLYIALLHTKSRILRPRTLHTGVRTRLHWHHAIFSRARKARPNGTQCTRCREYHVWNIVCKLMLVHSELPMLVSYSLTNVSLICTAEWNNRVRTFVGTACLLSP